MSRAQFLSMRGVVQDLSLRRLQRVWERAAASAFWDKHQRWIAAVAHVLRVLFPLALVGYLVFLLSRIGWEQIWRSLPTDPLFYALLLVLYFIQPTADLIIYRKIWGVGKSLALPVLLTKRFMNASLFDYSGEVYLLVWARRMLGLSERVIIHSIKDNGILSATSALVVLFALLSGLAVTGNWRIPFSLPENGWAYVLLALVPAFLCAGLVIARRQVTVLGARQIAFAFAVHLTRSIAVNGMFVALWALHMPSVPLIDWLNFLTVRMIISRVPMLPNKELVAITAGIGIAGLMGLPHAGVAAVLLTVSAGELLLNLLVLGLPKLVQREALPPSRGKGQPPPQS